MKKNNVMLYSYSPIVDDEGRVSRSMVLQGGIKGTMVPVNSELAAKEFGFDENVSHRFFCKDKSSFITAGNVIRCDGSDYNIVHVADYGKVKVVHLNTLIGNRHVRSVVQSLRY